MAETLRVDDFFHHYIYVYIYRYTDICVNDVASIQVFE